VVDVRIVLILAMINGAHTIQEELGGIMVRAFLMHVIVMLGELLSLNPSDLRRRYLRL